MLNFNLCHFFTKQRKNEKQSVGSICLEIEKAFNCWADLYPNNYKYFYDRFLSENLLPYLCLKRKIVKQSINGKTFSIEKHRHGYMLCKFDDDVYIEYQFDNAYCTSKCGFKALYKYDSNYSLAYEEYLPYLKAILDFINSESKKRKEEKELEFQKFRMISNFSPKRESKNLYDKNETVESKYDKLVKETYDA